MEGFKQVMRMVSTLFGLTEVEPKVKGGNYGNEWEIRSEVVV